MRMTNNFEEDASSWRGRVFLLMTYGRGYNYYYFAFSDHYSANHYFTTYYYFITNE